MNRNNITSQDKLHPDDTGICEKWSQQEKNPPKKSEAHLTLEEGFGEPMSNGKQMYLLILTVQNEILEQTEG